MEKVFDYLPQEKRKKILLITDDIRVHSGVAQIGREIVVNTAQHFNWVQLAGSITHPDKGKRFDLSAETNKLLEIEDSSVFLYPVDGYGNPDVLRQVIEIENPDGILLITDPRYFEYIFAMENELRKSIPIAYLNIWDDYPAPMYNRAYYEACDLLMGISKQTVNINSLVLGEKASNKLIKYVPHGLNTNFFFPIDDTYPKYKEFTDFRKNLFKNKQYEFVLFFNSRNIRRKQIPDTLLAFRYFLDKLANEDKNKVAFLIHTDTRVSDHGTDLNAIVDLVLNDYKDQIIFTDQKFGSEQMNWLYNCADTQILLSSNEGWGLSLTEALLTATPIIANVTGGMQDQMRFVDNEGKWFTPDSKVPSNHKGTYQEAGEWAYPVFPTNRSIQGSPKTPYIWDDRCRPEDAAEQIMNAYMDGVNGRIEKGLKGREWALGDEAGFTMTHQAKRVIDAFDELFSNWQPREKFELVNANETEVKVVPHKLLY